MKKGFLILLTMFTSLVFITSCSKNTPESTANAWLTAFYNQEYDDALNLSIEETRLALRTNFIGKIVKPGGSAKQAAYGVASSTDALTTTSVTIKSVETNGTEATVTFTISDDPTKTYPALKLVKQGGKWLVQTDPSILTK